MYIIRIKENLLVYLLIGRAFLKLYNFQWPLNIVIIAQVPAGFETDDKIDTELRPEESSLEDYEQVPIEQFGLALLRGMGWKEGEGEISFWEINVWITALII